MRKNNTEFQKIKNVILYIHSYECFMCNFVSTKNHVHHIDRNHSNNDPFNLIPLCPDCHKKIHSLLAVKVIFDNPTLVADLEKLRSLF